MTDSEKLEKIKKLITENSSVLSSIRLPVRTDYYGLLFDANNLLIADFSDQAGCGNRKILQEIANVLNSDINDQILTIIDGKKYYAYEDD